MLKSYYHTPYSEKGFYVSKLIEKKAILTEQYDVRTVSEKVPVKSLGGEPTKGHYCQS